MRILSGLDLAAEAFIDFFLEIVCVPSCHNTRYAYEDTDSYQASYYPGRDKAYAGAFLLTANRKSSFHIDRIVLKKQRS